MSAERSRREVLAALAAVGVAGCSNNSGDQEQTPTLTPVDVPGDAGTATATSTDEPDEADADGVLGERTTLARLRTVPQTYSLLGTEYGSLERIQATLSFVATATPTHPLTVRGTLTNEASRSTTFDLDDAPPFGNAGRFGSRTVRWRLPSAETGLAFVPTEATDYAVQYPDVELADDGRWRLSAPVEGSWYPDGIRLGTGETLVGEWYLVGRADRVTSGRPTGRYEFGYSDDPLAVAVWETHRPGPSERSRFVERNPPALPGERPVAWFHDATPETAVFLRPDPERAEIPAEFEFELVNHGTEALVGNPYALAVYKRVAGAWYRIAPWGVSDLRSVIRPGDSHEYAVRAYHGEAVPTEDDATGGALGHLGGGTYALAAGFARPGRDRRHAALFELVGPSVSVEPTPAATVERDGEQVTVTLPSWGNDDVENAIVRVTRWDAVRETRPRRVIAEQVYRPPYALLRDVVPHLDAASAVVVRAAAPPVERFLGSETEKRAFLWQNAPYLATRTA